MENKKPTVLLLSFIFSPNIGGVESHLDDLCDYLTHKNYTVRVITYQPIGASMNAPSFEKRKSIEIYRVSWLKNLFTIFEPYPLLQMLYLVPILFFYSFFYLYHHRKEIDIIQAHGFNMAVIGYLLRIFFNVPFTVNTHVLFYFRKESVYAKVLRNVLNKSKAVLVLTKDAKKQLIHIGVLRNKIIVYHQWVDAKLFSPHERKKGREKYRLPFNALVVLFTGRHVAAKGIPELLNVIEKQKDNPNIHFVITGSGELSSSIQYASERNPQLTFLGKVEKKELPILYSTADVCIFPSIQATQTYAEGIPRVMIEALSCGTPLIVTKTGGVGEVITKDVGFFVEPNVEEISKLLIKLTYEKGRLQAMRKQCMVYAKKEFGEKENGKIIEKSLS